MATQVKIVLVCAAAVGVGLWTWRELREPPRRTTAEGTRTAELVEPVVAAPPQDPAPIDRGALVQRESVPVAAPTATADATAGTTPAASPSIVVASTPLGRRLDAVADTFLTEEPDLVGLLSLASLLADAATFEVDEATGHASGNFSVGGDLKGTFSIHGLEYRVDVDTGYRSAPFRRTLALQFNDESRAARHADIRVQSLPSKRVIHDIDHEFIGWRASIDPTQGAKVFRTTMKVEDLNPTSDSYLFETSDVRDFEPSEQPWLADTDAFDRWLERLRPLRKQ